MNKLKRFVFLKYVNWRTSPRVVAWRRRLDERHIKHQARNGYWLEHVVFRVRHGYWPDLKNPRGFSERICAKKLHDRNPLLPILADKHRVRDFVRERLGPEADAILIPQIYVTDDPDTIPFETFDGDYVIKANHGAAMTVFHRAGEPLDQDLVRARLKLWLAQDYSVWLNEWAYFDIPRRVVVERLIQDSEIYCIDGVCKLIGVFDRYHESPSSNYFDGDLNPLDLHLGPYKLGVGDLPENIHEMITISERLSAGFDLLRVDLYSVEGQIYFGELTNYPGAGLSKIRPRKMVERLGQMWSESETGYPELPLRSA